MKLLRGTCIIFFVVLFFWQENKLTFAQETQQTIDLSLTTIPQNPTGGQPVTIQATSYSVDLNETTLNWLYNGKSIGSGYGKTKVLITAPLDGQTGVVEVAISGNNIQETVTNYIILTPGNVDLLWEGADSSTPPFYKGRALPAVDGLFRVVAVPSTLAPQEANYQWKLNGSSLQTASGNNKTGVVIKNNPLIKEKSVSVTVSGGSFQGTKNATIPTTNPLLVAYQKKDGFIDFTRGSIDTINMVGDSGTLRIEPFFFSIPKGVEKSLLFSFTTNEEKLFPNTAQNEISLSKPENTTKSQISVVVTTATYSLQNAKRVFSLLFQ